MGFPTIIVCALAVTGAVWDMRTGRIPNGLTIPALVAGLLYASDHGLLLWSLAGAILGGGLYLLLGLAGAMGGGDVKLGAALGAWGGFAFAAVMLVLASVAGGVQALWATRHAWLAAAMALLSGRGIQNAYAVFRQAYEPEKTVPYGVAIGTGALAAVLWPMLPGTVGAMGRDIYALFASIAP